MKVLSFVFNPESETEEKNKPKCIYLGYMIIKMTSRTWNYRMEIQRRNTLKAYRVLINDTYVKIYVCYQKD